MTDFTKLHKTALDMQVEFDKITKEFQNKMRSMFIDMTNSFFEAAPEIKAVVWNQYTPYFNDGAECVFGIYDRYFLTEFDEKDLQDAYDYEDSAFPLNASEENFKKYQVLNEKYPSPYYESEIESIEKALKNPRNAELTELCESMSDLIISNEDLMRTIFGDHVTVYLTYKKSFVEAYEHE